MTFAESQLLGQGRETLGANAEPGRRAGRGAAVSWVPGAAEGGTMDRHVAKKESIAHIFSESPTARPGPGLGPAAGSTFHPAPTPGVEVP